MTNGNNLITTEIFNYNENIQLFFNKKNPTTEEIVNQNKNICYFLSLKVLRITMYALSNPVIAV